jgi:hypothetical protein
MGTSGSRVHVSLQTSRAVSIDIFDCADIRERESVGAKSNNFVLVMSLGKRSSSKSIRAPELENIPEIGYTAQRIQARVLPKPFVVPQVDNKVVCD